MAEVHWGTLQITLKSIIRIYYTRCLWYNTFNASLLCVESIIEEFFGNTETNETDKTIVTLPLVEKNHALFSEGHEKGHEKGYDVNARA